MGLKLGDAVETTKDGSGVIVAIFATLHGSIRYVVESIASDSAGELRIYSQTQIRKPPIDPCML